jgi:hypothetical protein
MNSAQQLYEALKALPNACKCRYQIPVGPYNAATMDTPLASRKRTFQCARCAALERYEIERDEF